MYRNSVKIFLIHSNKAILPEIRAYKRFFEKRGFEVIDIEYNKLKFILEKELKTSILWYFMGFYPTTIEAKFIIHDYRSLSIGKFARMKDKIKKIFNRKPNLRIFLNKNIKKALNFNDNIPYVYIDMGLPETIFNYIYKSYTKKYDFIYVGAINKEREIDKLLQVFFKKYGTKKSFILVGPYEIQIKNKFSRFRNIIFTGKLPQGKVFELIKQSEFSISLIPNKYPYYYQTPTKLLEYLALGSKIIINNNPMQISLLKKTGNLEKVFIMKYQNYDDFPSEMDLKFIDQCRLDSIEKYLWENLLIESRILEYIGKEL